MSRILALALFFTLLTPLSVAADEYLQGGTYAVVTGSVVNIRSYSEISNNRVFQVSRGTQVAIHGVCGDFFIATVNGVAGVYISREWVRFTQTEGVVTAEGAVVYDLPAEAGGTMVYVIPQGEIITVTSEYNNWYGVEIDGLRVFVEKEAVTTPYFVELPTARLSTSGALADEVIATAMNYLGTPYLWGGTTPNGFDCSGFMTYIFLQFDISLNRRSRDMALNGTFVAFGDLQPGDLVFYGFGGQISGINHVALYIGNGQIIHSSSSRSGGVIISEVACRHSAPFITARRVLEE